VEISPLALLPSIRSYRSWNSHAACMAHWHAHQTSVGPSRGGGGGRGGGTLQEEEEEDGLYLRSKCGSMERSWQSGWACLSVMGHRHVLCVGPSTVTQTVRQSAWVRCIAASVAACMAPTTADHAKVDSILGLQLSQLLQLAPSAHPPSLAAFVFRVPSCSASRHACVSLRFTMTHHGEPGAPTRP
jgi:hypothetical protein